MCEYVQLNSGQYQNMFPQHQLREPIIQTRNIPRFQENLQVRCIQQHYRRLSTNLRKLICQYMPSTYSWQQQTRHHSFSCNFIYKQRSFRQSAQKNNHQSIICITYLKSTTSRSLPTSSLKLLNSSIENRPSGNNALVMITYSGNRKIYMRYVFCEGLN